MPKFMPKPSFFNWSGGKDSAMALHKMLQDPQFNIEALLTNVNSDTDRISMHGVRRSLLQKQAESIQIPLHTIELNSSPSLKEYEAVVDEKLLGLKKEGLDTAVFGDIFLEDLRSYRENHFSKSDIETIFPLWGHNTKELMRAFIEEGFKAVVVCVKSELLDESFVGRELDDDFIESLPDNVDPCGENGEFHTFVYDGPIFTKAIPFEKGEVVFKSYKAPQQQDDECKLSNETDEQKMGFWFLDLLDTP